MPRLPVCRREIPALLATALALLLGLSATPGRSQETAEPPSGEIVADLAAGRVIIAVVKDAILVATVENPIEPETRPPTPVALSSDRLGVILGAVEWFTPPVEQPLAQLDKELPHLRSHIGLAPVNPQLQQDAGGGEATDIEAVGQGLLGRLNDVAQGLHAKLDWPPDQPIAELVIADYLGGYGPEVWQLTYPMKQEFQKHDYWATSVLRPTYLQFWPPEKGQPRTLMEFDYPAGAAGLSLLDLLRQGDPAIEKIRSSDATMAEVANLLLRGESGKIRAAAATQFLRASLDAIAPPRARQTMAAIGAESGFAWIIPPPAEPHPARPQPRPAGVPTLDLPDPDSR